jgi:hypothetical protein
MIGGVMGWISERLGFFKYFLVPKMKNKGILLKELQHLHYKLRRETQREESF